MMRVASVLAISLLGTALLAGVRAARVEPASLQAGIYENKLQLVPKHLLSPEDAAAATAAGAEASTTAAAAVAKAQAAAAAAAVEPHDVVPKKYRKQRSYQGAAAAAAAAASSSSRTSGLDMQYGSRGYGYDEIELADVVIDTNLQYIDRHRSSHSSRSKDSGKEGRLGLGKGSKHKAEEAEESDEQAELEEADIATTGHKHKGSEGSKKLDAKKGKGKDKVEEEVDDKPKGFEGSKKLDAKKGKGKDKVEEEVDDKPKGSEGSKKLDAKKGKGKDKEEEQDKVEEVVNDDHAFEDFGTNSTDTLAGYGYGWPTTPAPSSPEEQPSGPVAGGCKPGTAPSSVTGSAIVIDNSIEASKTPYKATSECMGEPANTFQFGGTCELSCTELGDYGKVVNTLMSISTGSDGQTVCGALRFSTREMKGICSIIPVSLCCEPQSASSS